MTLTGVVTYDFVPAVYVPGEGGGLDFARAQARPVRGGVVRVIEDDALLGSTVTDEDGHYTLTVNASGGDVQVQALTQTQSPPIRVEDNTDGDLLWGVVKRVGTDTTTVDLHAPHGWTGARYEASQRAAAPFAVLDSMYTAAQAFIAVRNTTFPELKVNWSPNNAPQAGDKSRGQISTSHFSPQEGEIYILGLEGADTDEFDANVIVHEWGHYFEAKLSRSDSPGGPHGQGYVLDPRIAFGEAWGTAVAAMKVACTMYVDTVWSNGQLLATGSDAETPPGNDDPTPGVFSEYSLIRALYDLYDNTADGPHDQAAVGLGAVYDVMVGHQRTTPTVTTIGSFLTGLKLRDETNAAYLAGIDATVAYYNIGSIVNDLGQGDDPLFHIYTVAPSLPFNTTLYLGGGHASNTWEQNQYYVFEGTGGTVTFSASSVDDVAFTIYENGTRVAIVDENESGLESYGGTTVADTLYVVIVTGFGQRQGDYPITITIQ